MTITDNLIIKYLRALDLPLDVKQKNYIKAYRSTLRKIHPDKNDSKIVLFAGMQCKEITALHLVIMSNYEQYGSPTKKPLTIITLSSDDEDLATTPEPNAENEKDGNQQEEDPEPSDEPEFDIYADPYGPWR